MIEEIFYFFQFFIKLTKRSNLMKKILLSAIIFCCLGTTSCFSSLSILTLDEVIDKIQMSGNPQVADEEGKIWEYTGNMEKLNRIHTYGIRNVESINIMNMGEVGSTETFRLYVPKDLTFTRRT